MRFLLFDSSKPRSQVRIVAKYNVGKVRLKWPAVFRVTVHDLRGGPLGICRAIVYCCIACAVLLADRCGSFALCLANLCGFLPVPKLINCDDFNISDLAH